MILICRQCQKHYEAPDYWIPYCSECLLEVKQAHPSLPYPYDDTERCIKRGED